VGHSHSERKRQNCSAPSAILHGPLRLVRSGVCTPVLGVGQTPNPRHVRISTEATRPPIMLHSCLFGLRSSQSSHSTHIVSKNQAGRYTRNDKNLHDKIYWVSSIEKISSHKDQLIMHATIIKELPCSPHKDWTNRKKRCTVELIYVNLTWYLKDIQLNLNRLL